MLLPTIDRIGGAENQVLLLLRGLKARGWNVSLVTLSGDGGDAGKALATDGICHFSLKMRKGLADPRGWWRFHRWMREQTPDIVHAHLPHAAWFARWSGLLFPRAAIVDTIHTSSRGTLGRRFGYKLSDRLTDIVTAVSSACADAYVTSGMVKSRHLRVIPNGIDIQAWYPEPGMQPGLRSEIGAARGFLWLAAGRLQPVKDYPTLLHALTLLSEPAHLVIAGAGESDAELRTLVRQLNLETRVTFLGFQHDLKRWMHAADGFVQASLWEGLPMAILEASACGLVTVATDVPGTREVIRSGMSGLLVPTRNARALADAMQTTMQLTHEDRSKMADNARRHIVENYNLSHVLNQWESLYVELLR